MTRAKRHYISDYVWHITQRCHKKEFLLKFHHDRRRWLYWLYQAKQRFNFSILNYIVTSNHIHLLAFCDRENNHIAKAIHLTSGRTAWEYNQRKKRRGAFWEDRYHATAVETGQHLIRCMVYMDMNMVRAGVVKHPREWPYCGYQEITGRRQRYTLIDMEKLIRFLDVDTSTLMDTYQSWSEKYLDSKKICKESHWTESIAVGSKNFIEKIQAKLGVKAKGRKKVETNGFLTLHESGRSYRSILPLKIPSKGKNHGTE